MLTLDSPKASEKVTNIKRLLREIERFQAAGEFSDFDLLMRKVGAFVARLHAARQELLTTLAESQDIFLKREIVVALGRTIQAIRDLEKGLCLIGKSGRLNGILATTQPVSNLVQPVLGNCLIPGKKKAQGRSGRKTLLLCLPQSVSL